MLNFSRKVQYDARESVNLDKISMLHFYFYFPLVCIVGFKIVIDILNSVLYFIVFSTS